MPQDRDPGPRAIRRRGRDAELAWLPPAFAAAGRGSRQTVFVTGEPGIGKTAVIDAFVAERRRGAARQDGGVPES